MLSSVSAAARIQPRKKRAQPNVDTDSYTWCEQAANANSRQGMSATPKIKPKMERVPYSVD
jgi:hypothetical protein